MSESWTYQLNQCVNRIVLVIFGQRKRDNPEGKFGMISHCWLASVSQLVSLVRPFCHGAPHYTCAAATRSHFSEFPLWEETVVIDGVRLTPSSSEWVRKGKIALLGNLRRKWEFRSSLVAHWVKDLALSLQWLRFSHWPGNFHMPKAWPKKKRRRRRKKITLYHCFFYFYFCIVSWSKDTAKYPKPLLSRAWETWLFNLKF